MPGSRPGWFRLPDNLREIAPVRVSIAIALIAAALVVGFLAMRSKPPATEAVAPNHALAPPPSNGFLPTTENQNRPSETAPRGMVWIPGGEFSMGAQDPPDMRDPIGMQATTDSRPVHRVLVDGFWMDATEVTNEAFKAFVTATGYITVAERKPRAEDFPGATARGFGRRIGRVFASRPCRSADQRVFGGRTFAARTGGTRPARRVPSRERNNGPSCTWPMRMRWRTRNGPASACRPKRSGNLPRAAGWPARCSPGAMRSNRRRWMANSHQGHFPDHDSGADAFAGIAPVAQFPPNGYGLYDVAGNVWEWTSDWYRPDYYRQLAAMGYVARNPQGPADSFDPAEPGVRKRVHRGGSFLCTDQFCSRYMVGTRGKGEISTGTNHLGFRCVKPLVTSSTRPSSSTQR